MSNILVNVEILDKAIDQKRLPLNQVLHVNKIKPVLNVQKRSKFFS